VALEFCHDSRASWSHGAASEGAAFRSRNLDAFAQEARELLRSWVGEVAGEEEHRVWNEVVRFTHARARSLIREGTVSTASGWELTHSYAETAARLAAILAHDYEEHARGASWAWPGSTRRRRAARLALDRIDGLRPRDATPRASAAAAGPPR
jgi:hypothetical protein